MPIGVFLVLLWRSATPGVRQPGRDDGPDLCLRAGDDAPGLRHVLGAEGLDWKVPYFLFVLLVAVGVDYNVFLMTRLHEESQKRGLREGIIRAVGQTGGLITSAAAITACSFASFLFSPLGSLRQLGFALVVGILSTPRWSGRCWSPAATGCSAHPRGPLAAHRRQEGPPRVRRGAGLNRGVWCIALIRMPVGTKNCCTPRPRGMLKPSITTTRPTGRELLAMSSSSVPSPIGDLTGLTSASGSEDLATLFGRPKLEEIRRTQRPKRRT